MSVVNYKYPVTGTVGPGTQAMATASSVIAVVSMADSDTTAAITHNFGAGGEPSYLGDLADLFPIVTVNANTVTVQTTAVVVTVAWTDSNTITLGKPATVGSSGSWTVQIIRPPGIMR